MNNNSLVLSLLIMFWFICEDVTLGQVTEKLNSEPQAVQQSAFEQMPLAGQVALADQHNLPAFICLDHFNMPGWLAQPTIFQSMVTTKLAKNGEPTALALTSEYGCLMRASKCLARGQRQIIANIYYFTRSEGAYGAYCGLREGASNLIAKGDASSEDATSISFWKDHYFINVFGTANDDDESKEVVTKLAEALINSIPTKGQKPELLSYLPTFERVQGSEKIVMGPLALKKFFPAPYIAKLGSESFESGAVADYKLQAPPERVKLLMIRFPSPVLASQAFARYTGQLEEEHDPQATAGLSYQTSQFKIGNFYILCQLRGNFVVIINGAHKKNSLVTMARLI